MTGYGGTNNKGCIFKIKIDGSEYAKLFDFDGAATGGNPYGSLTISGDILYGMTTYGGANDMGCIFKIYTNGSGYTRLFDFSGTADGRNAQGSLIISGNILYGMTEAGGANDEGSIFKINTDGTGYTQLFDFNGLTYGYYPFGALTISDSVLYGMTSQGGTNNNGCIFIIYTDGSGYKKLFDFNNTATGSFPKGTLAISGNVLYGMTSEGGTNSYGCIFSINTDGSGYAKLFDFDGTPNGGFPQGSLILSGDILYGMTSYDCINGYGCLFQFDLNHYSYLKLLDFNGTENGSKPDGDPIFCNNTLYGMTAIGGSNNDGVIFKYVFVPTIQTSNIDFPFVGTNVANISWINGNGESRAIFVKEGTGTITYPDNNTTYNASSDWNTKGSQLGSSAYYCIYNGSGNMISLNNLDPGITYTVQAFEYNGNAGSEQYLLDAGTGNPITFLTESVNAIQDNREDLVRIFSDGSDIYAVIGHCNTTAQLAVYNLTGICMTQSNNLVEGQNRITGNYPPGIYIVKLVLNDTLYTRKVRIQK
jgi:uncharacterized repeat protein (TIGR03803 family)